MKKIVLGLAGCLVLIVSAGCSGDQLIEEIVLSNPTAYTATIEVTDGAGGSALSLATVPAGSEVTVKEVIDQGPTWSFRFAYAGHEEGMEISRSRLEGSGWEVVVPESFATALRDKGVAPPP